MRLLGSGLLSKPNAERSARIFYDAAKLIYERQKRMKKPELKIKEMTSALVLVDFHHANCFHFEAKDHLAENFGPCPEAKALEYYDRKVMGEATDTFGRTIRIDEQGMRSLYKDHETGRHIVATENYEEVRGKRLPWIRHVLQVSKAVYVVEEEIRGNFRRSYLYTAVPSIPITPKPRVSYFVIVVREDHNRKLWFLTAYDMAKYNNFIRIIERAKPWRREGESG
jgi:hypothetical protein